MPGLRPVAHPSAKLSRASRLDLAFWSVLVAALLAALVRAVVRGDADRILMTGTFFLTAAFWLVRTWWSRRDLDGVAASPSPALAPPRLWLAGGILLLAGSVALMAGALWPGAVLIGVAVAFVLPLALEDRRRRERPRQPR